MFMFRFGLALARELRNRNPDAKPLEQRRGWILRTVRSDKLRNPLWCFLISLFLGLSFSGTLMFLGIALTSSSLICRMFIAGCGLGVLGLVVLWLIWRAREKNLITPEYLHWVDLLL